jgi:quercetin dioxygenase-like cupin family protein
MNVLQGIPYGDSGMGKRKLVDEKHLLMMQVALKPGQTVPQHHANSNVHLLVVVGEVVVDLDGRKVTAAKGDLVPVAFKTPMSVANQAGENASFLIIKTPNPSEMEQDEEGPPSRAPHTL